MFFYLLKLFLADAFYFHKLFGGFESALPGAVINYPLRHYFANAGQPGEITS